MKQLQTLENFSFSKFLLFQIFLVWIFLFFYNGNNKRDHINYDVLEYYSYLPATFICGDVTLQHFERDKCTGRYWLVATKDGKRLIRMTMGMAFMYAPFFLIAHFVAPLLHDVQDGYSATYQSLLAYGTIFYLILGLSCLRKLLLNFYSDKITAAIVACLFFGTNLFCYSTCTGDLLMAHSYLFSLTCFIMYFSKKLYERPAKFPFFLLGFLIGLMFLTRPTDVIIILVPILYGVKDIEGLRLRVLKIKKFSTEILIFLIAFMIPIIPQLLYWKATTGHWIFYSYMGNSFYFLSPYLIEGLFGFRKGLFIYTPILLISVLGFLNPKKIASEFLLSIVVIVPVFTYVTLSWWCWWYGGSFGNRPFIDMYPILAFPLGVGLNYLSQRINLVKGFAIVIVEGLILLNLFQTWQFKQGILHYDSMTKEAYFSVFGKRDYPNDYLKLISEPDIERAYLGLSEKKSLKDFHSFKFYLKSVGYKYLHCDQALNGKIMANKIEKTDREQPDVEQFFIQEKGNTGQFSIKAYNGKYWRIDENGEVTAKSDTLCEECIFKINFLEREGWIAISTPDNKYLEVDQNRGILKLGTADLKDECMFKVFTAHNNLD